jgi:glycosyltransferase involved in cell wall biosynthesis
LKLLFYGESPQNPTGFGNVNNHLLAACARVADVTMVASTHYLEDYDHEKYPYKIIGCEIVPVAERDATHQRNLPNIMKEIEALDWDVFMYMGDCGWNNDVLIKVGLLLQEHPEKYAIFYMPIDGDVAHSLSFNIFKMCNAPVVYTYHAKSVIEKYAPDVAETMSVIQLGCETNLFYPLSEKKRKAARLKLFGEKYMDTFLCINVNRNQQRKDLARCMGAFHMFHQKHPDSSLYMHSVQNDAGGHLPTQAVMVGCDILKRPAEIVFSGLDLANPWARETLNEVYNAADVLISTAHGEGWGLCTTESMSAGIPVVVPANTANLDILGEQIAGFEYERGWGVRTGGDLDHTVFMYANGGGPVSTIHSDSFVETLEYVYYHRDEAKAKAKVAHSWCLKNTWEQREKDWENLLKLMATKPASEEVMV